MGWVWKKSVITLYGLVLHCSSDSRVVSYGCLGTLKPEIFREIYLPQYKSHGAKFHQNPRFCVGNHFHDLENVSVKNTAKSNHLHRQKVIFEFHNLAYLLKRHLYIYIVFSQSVPTESKYGFHFQFLCKMRTISSLLESRLMIAQSGFET